VKNILALVAIVLRKIHCFLLTRLQVFLWPKFSTIPNTGKCRNFFLLE